VSVGGFKAHRSYPSHSPLTSPFAVQGGCRATAVRSAYVMTMLSARSGEPAQSMGTVG
jgi:hypothetical protein